MLDVRVRGNVIPVVVIDEIIGERGQVKENGREKQESRKQPEIRRCFRIRDGSVWGAPLAGANVNASRTVVAGTYLGSDSQVQLVTTEERAFTVAVQLDVSLPSVADAAEAVELVRQAHRVCPYSNATRGNIDVTLTANGQPVPD